MSSSGNRTITTNTSSLMIPADHSNEIIVSPCGSTSSAVATVIPRLLAWAVHPTKKAWWPSVLYPTWKDAAKDAKILHNPQTQIRIHTCTNMVSIEDLARNRVPGKVAISRHPGIVVCYYLGLSQQQQRNNKSVAVTETAVEWDVTKTFQGYRSFYDQALQSHAQHGTLDSDLLCALEEAYVFLGSKDTQLLRGIPSYAVTAYSREKKRSLSQHAQEQPNKKLQSHHPGSIIQNTPQWYHEWEDDPTQPSQRRDTSQFTQSFAINATTNVETTPTIMQELPPCRNQNSEIAAFVNPTHPMDKDEEARILLSNETHHKEDASTPVSTRTTNDHLANDKDKCIHAKTSLATMPPLDHSPKSTHNNSKEDGNFVQQQCDNPAIIEVSLDKATSTEIPNHQNMDDNHTSSNNNAVTPKHITKEDHNQVAMNSYAEDALHTENVLDTNAVQNDIPVNESSQHGVPFKQIAVSRDLPSSSIPQQLSNHQDEANSTSPLPKIQAIDRGFVIGMAPTREEQPQVRVSTPEPTAERTTVEHNLSSKVTWDCKTKDGSQHVPVQTNATGASNDEETNFDHGQNCPTPKSKNTHRTVTPFPQQQQLPTTTISSKMRREEHDASRLLLSPPDEKFVEEFLEEESLETDIWFFTQ